MGGGRAPVPGELHGKGFGYSDKLGEGMLSGMELKRVEVLSLNLSCRVRFG